jgi:hypothetical protein
MFRKPARLFAISCLTLGAVACAANTAIGAPQDPAASEAPEYAEDGRRILYLTPVQKEHVSNEMRGFLMGVQGLTEAIADEDRPRIAELATSMGPKGPGGGMGHGMGHGQGKGSGMGQGMGRGMGSGMGQGQGMGGGRGVMANQPPEFHAIGQSLRLGFKDIAEMAPTADMKDIQYALAGNLTQCTACHASFAAVDAK